jgi:hypothetical protein
VAFLTAGDPSLERTADAVVELAEAGADVVELGGRRGSSASRSVRSHGRIPIFTSSARTVDG